MKHLLILFVCALTTSCTTYNYIGDPKLGARKWDTVIISPPPASMLQPKNAYPGAEEYLLPEPPPKNVILFDYQSYIDSCVLVNSLRTLKS